jgi:hypothetical protein
MKANKIKPDATNPVVDESSEDENRLKRVTIEMNEHDRIVPVVVFEFHDRIPEGCCSIPCPYDDDMWDEGIGVNVQPISNAVRVHIRPDVSKKTVQTILKKLIKIIGQDKYDWPEETDNFLNNWKKEVEAKRRNKDKSDMEAA